MLSRIALCWSSLHIDSKTSVLSVILVLLFWKLFTKNRKYELIAKMPGPRAYPIVGNLFELLKPGEEFLRDSLERGKKYGPLFVMWVGRIPVVNIFNPEYIEEVLHSSKHLRKSVLYRFIEGFIGDGLITSWGEKWAMHRKLLTPAFHFKILDSFFHVFHDRSSIMLGMLDEKASTGVEFDISKYIKNCTLDILCEAAMGVKVNAQEDVQSDYIKAVQRLTVLIVERLRKVWLHPDVIYNLTATGREHNRHLKVVHGFVDGVIEQRKRLLKESMEDEPVSKEAKEYKGKTRLAFLDLLLRANIDSNMSMTDKELRDEVDTFMFAGHDTTTAAITWAIYLIGRHPKIQEELYQEQREIFAGEMNRPITMTDVSRMNVLERVIKESLRLFPSVPFISRTLDEDVRFGDYIVPEGTTVSLQIFQLHRNPKIYPDPEKFDPDRFLPENADKRHNYAFVPFSAGPRNCLGKRFALYEEKFILSTLVRRYVIHAVEKQEDLHLAGEIILRSLSGINVTLNRRANPSVS